MAIDKDVIAQAIAALSSVEGVLMQPSSLAEDAMLLTLAFEDETAYKTAVVNTVKAFKDIVRGRVTPADLSGAYDGWSSYHYQPRVAQGGSASMRVIFKRVESAVYVLGFGHRYVPGDVYRRLGALRLR